MVLNVIYSAGYEQRCDDFILLDHILIGFLSNVYSNKRTSAESTRKKGRTDKEVIDVGSYEWKYAFHQTLVEVVEDWQGVIWVCNHFVLRHFVNSKLVYSLLWNGVPMHETV